MARLDPVEITTNRWSVQGDSGTYSVTRIEDKFSCTCRYASYGKDCTHIDSVRYDAAASKKEDMNNGIALAIADTVNTALPVAYSIREVSDIAKKFADSGFFKDAKSEAQAFAKILAGQELGIGPMASMSQLHVVEGKVTMDATLVGSQIKRSGRYDYKVIESTNNGCTLEFFERGKSVGFSAFTMDDAKNAGLAHKNVWKSYPKDMCRSRAMTRGARTYCPDVFNGAIYTPDEIAGEPIAINEPVASTSGPATNSGVPLKAEVMSEAEERKHIIPHIYSILQIETKGKKNDDPVHTKAIASVASALAVSPNPKKWSDFTIDQLRRFAAGDHVEPASAGYCDICSTTDGEHREECPEAPQDAAFSESGEIEF